MDHDSIILASVSAIAALVLPGCEIEWDAEADNPQRTYGGTITCSPAGDVCASALVHGRTRPPSTPNEPYCTLSGGRRD